MPDEPNQPVEPAASPATPVTPVTPEQPTIPPQPRPIPLRVPMMAVPPGIMMNQDTQTIYLNYFDQITEQKIRALMAICSELIARHRPRQLYFLFSSTGGQVNAGITFYNFLRALPTEIVMHNIGSIDSIATVIFMAGAKRYAAQHSTFLFHGISSNFTQPISITKSKYKELLSGLEKDENKIAGIIAERSRLGEVEMRQLFLHGEAKDLTFALEKGIIQEVRDAAIPNNAPIMSLNLQ